MTTATADATTGVAGRDARPDHPHRRQRDRPRLRLLPHAGGAVDGGRHRGQGVGAGQLPRQLPAAQPARDQRHHRPLQQLPHEREAGRRLHRPGPHRLHRRAGSQDCSSCHSWPGTGTHRRAQLARAPAACRSSSPWAASPSPAARRQRDHHPGRHRQPAAPDRRPHHLHDLPHRRRAGGRGPSATTTPRRSPTPPAPPATRRGATSSARSGTAPPRQAAGAGDTRPITITSPGDEGRGQLLHAHQRRTTSTRSSAASVTSCRPATGWSPPAPPTPAPGPSRTPSRR